MTIDELHMTIDGLEKWSKDKKIAINRKKSGILKINDDGKDCKDIRGFPIVSEYIYLGVLNDSKMRPRRHVTKVKIELNTYIIRMLCF